MSQRKLIILACVVLFYGLTGLIVIPFAEWASK